MFLYPSPAEGLAWLKGSADELARFDALTFASAAERRQGETPAEDDGSTT